MRIAGRVVGGDKVGRGLGYPTANVEVDDSLVAESGVYAAVVEVDGRRYGAMAYLGVKPTFSDEGRRVLELHLTGFEGDLYGREVAAELVEYVRPEQKFADAAALAAQITKDEKIVKEILRSCLKFPTLALSASESALFSPTSLAVGTPTPRSAGEKSADSETKIASVGKFKQLLKRV
ncbi:MAG: riboflavin kinase [Alistipes sp.]|jgi:hypothetical protein|nr:riboflavin kinase [Alistipes sp.]